MIVFANHQRIPRSSKLFELGDLFEAGWGYPKKDEIYKFIQVTPKGFNFLNIRTNKCLLKRHLFKSKYGDFWINKNMKFNKLKENQFKEAI